MSKNILTQSKSLAHRLLLISALVIGWNSAAEAEELVVTSTTSKTYTGNVPIMGTILDQAQIQCEYIIPAAKLTEMKGGTISKMSLTVATPATASWGDAEFKVFLKEVTESAYTSSNPVVLLGTTDATVVYEGKLDATKSTLDVTFSSSFAYGSDDKNLLVGIYCTKTGTASGLNFKLIRENTSDLTYYCAYTSAAAGTLTRTNWYPETTFTYQTAASTTPALKVAPNEVAFGENTATPAGKTFTVTNTGIGTMSVNITSADAGTNFSVSPATFSLGAGESQEVTVTFSIGGDNYTYGAKSATFAVAATDGTNPTTGWAGDTKNVSVTGTSVDPNAADFTLDENVNPGTLTEQTYNKVLFKYTAKKGWNTFCVPFPVKDYLETIFGTGYTAYMLSAYENGTVTFNAAFIYAGTGAGLVYLVKAPNAPASTEGVMLSNVQMKTTAAGKTTQGTANFRGTYAPKAFVENDNWYGITTDGQIRKAAAGATLKGFRGYLTGISAPANGGRLSIVIEGETGTTDLGFVKMIDATAKDVFTLSGQKVSKAGKGIYVVNGRKVVIK